MANHQFFVRAAPLLFVMLWSTGFIAAKYSMANADPFVFLCLRMTITAIVLIPILWLTGAELPKSIFNHRHDMVTGVLLHCCYLGFLFWPIKDGMPSGIVAIIIGIQPILTTALATLYIGESWQVEWTPGFALALSWQVFGLSIGAVVLLMAIIKLGEAGRVSSMFYLVPPLVVAEAHFLFGETLGLLSIAGMALCIIGVFFSIARARLPAHKSLL